MMTKRVKFLWWQKGGNSFDEIQIDFIFFNCFFFQNSIILNVSVIFFIDFRASEKDFANMSHSSADPNALIEGVLIKNHTSLWDANLT